MMTINHEVSAGTSREMDATSSANGDERTAFERSTSATTSSSPMDSLGSQRGFEADALIRKLLQKRFLININDTGSSEHEENIANVMINNETETELLEILEVLTEELSGRGTSASELNSHNPVGEWVWTACEICLEQRWLHKRPCCSLPVCNKCLKIYYSIKVNEGVVKIECCSSKCKHFVHRDEISGRLDASDKQKFHQFLLEANSDPSFKTCPRCSHVTTPLDLDVKLGNIKSTKNHPLRSRLVCSECNLPWCFNCHAPWHNGLSCQQYRKGDRSMKSWANQIHHGQLNAQKCPRCQAYIQRTTGCDHMHCSRCKTDFCYRCGDRLRKLRFFGDHYSKLSVFGCKYRYKADKPLQRKLTRAAVFGSKVMVVPLLGTLGVCACVLALGFGMFILPVYGGVRLYHKLNNEQEEH